MTSINKVRDYVLDTARENIESIKNQKRETSAAKQINSSLTSIVAMERNIIMDKVTKIAEKKIELKTIDEA